MRPGPSAAGWTLRDPGGVGRSRKNDGAIPARQRLRAAVAVNLVGAPVAQAPPWFAAGHLGIRRGLENLQDASRRHHSVCNLPDADRLCIYANVSTAQTGLSAEQFSVKLTPRRPLLRARPVLSRSPCVCRGRCDFAAHSVAMSPPSTSQPGITPAGAAEHVCPHPRQVRSLRAADNSGTMAAPDRRRACRRVIQDHQMAKSGLAPMPQIRAR
jgi:hypothetical protein